jgi:hypothetical protein
MERFFWIICRDPDTGHPFLIAGGNSEMEARQKGMEALSGVNFEIRELPTRNLQRASSMIRGKRLDETHSLRAAKQRLGHDRSVARMRRRLQH